MGRLVILLGLVLGVWAAPVRADAPLAEGAVVTVGTLGTTPDYPVLTRGSVVFVNAQRFVVTREPLPIATVAEAPPQPKVADEQQPTAPSASAVWIAGHWAYGPTGYTWIAGRYVAQRVGHVFVPPRWAFVEEQYLYFTGFYVPRGVYVRSHFNRYYYSGAPKQRSGVDHGPYWPVGAPTPGNRQLTSASARDPYWPIGARR